ncbi:MAG: tape measure protein [Deltaproteobacteria bacterium]|nr:tape measure protein [Deltaproteobacteria bacterium]
MPTSTSQEHFVRIRVVSRDAAKQLGNMDKTLKKTQKSVGGLQQSFTRLNGAIGLLVGANLIGGAIKGAVRLVDSYQELGGRIKLVADATVGLEQAQDDLNQVAMDTYSSYDAIGTLYARMGMSMKGLQVAHEDLISATETVAITLRLSGASAQETRSSMLQLSQAMASGKLAGDEYRSISENNVALMDLLATALDKTRGELKKMSKDGLLTTTVVFNALIKQQEKYKKLVEGLPLTVNRAMTNLETAWQSLLNESAADNGIDTIAESIDALARTLNDPATKAGFAWFMSFVIDGLRLMAASAGSISGMFETIGVTLKSVTISRLEEEHREELEAIRAHDLEIQNMRELQDLANTEDAKKIWDVKIAYAEKGMAELREKLKDLPTLFGFNLYEGYFSGDDEMGAEMDRIDKIFRDLDKAELKKLQNTGLSGGGGGSDKKTDMEKYAESVMKAENAVDLLFQKHAYLDEQMTLGNIGSGTYMAELDKIPGGVAQVVSSLEEYIDSVIALDQEQEYLWQQEMKLVEAFNQGKISLEELTAAQEKLGLVSAKVIPDIESMGEALTIAVGGAIKGFTGDLSDAIVDFALLGKTSFADMAESMVASLAKVILQTQMIKALETAFPSLFADGAVFQGGNEVTAFASGGVVSSPTIFPMADGIGLMGEAGPEAVMPLTRINGKLGVQSTGGGTTVNVINNSGGEATTTERPNGNGGMDIQVIIERAVDNYVGSGGANSMFGTQFGARPIPR